MADKYESYRKQFIQAILKEDLAQDDRDVLSEILVRDIEQLAQKKEEGKSASWEIAASTKVHKPCDMVAFLYQFSKDDAFFKWFAHDPEFREIDYLSNLSLVKAKLAEESKKYNLNVWTYLNVSNFLSKDTAYPTKDSFNSTIKYSWRDTLKWLAEHQRGNPFKDFHPDSDGKAFEDYIDQFKHTIEFRTDNRDLLFNSRLTELIYDHCGLTDETRSNLDIQESVDSIGSSLKTYIDVRMFFSGIQKIFKWIERNRAISTNVSVSLEVDDISYTLTIFHKGSYLTLDNIKLLGQDGDMLAARQNFFCVADWTIEADRKLVEGNVPVKIECVSSQTKGEQKETSIQLSPSNVVELDHGIGGVKHIIRFYKNTGK